MTYRYSALDRVEVPERDSSGNYLVFIVEIGGGIARRRNGDPREQPLCHPTIVVFLKGF